MAEREEGHSPSTSEDGEAGRECEEAGCDREAAVRLHVPWTDDRLVCTAHARVLVQQDGVVAEPLEGADWP